MRYGSNLTSGSNGRDNGLYAHPQPSFTPAAEMVRVFWWLVCVYMYIYSKASSASYTYIYTYAHPQPSFTPAAEMESFFCGCMYVCMCVHVHSVFFYACCGHGEVFCGCMYVCMYVHVQRF